MHTNVLRNCRLIRPRTSISRLRKFSSALAEEVVNERDSHVSTFAGGVTLPFTSRLDIVAADRFPVWPVYSVLGYDGSIREGAQEPDLKSELLQKVYNNMQKLRLMDHILYNAQRQGRITFYMTSGGEEALQIASAAALDPKDMVFAQYREPGILMWRGFTLQNFADQCCGNESDLGKGRQMPVHYGSQALCYQTISSPLATQVPQAAGAAYAMKVRGQPNIAMCYFGDGAASEGDCHAAFNMAATLSCPVIFFCRNNGYAISTPTADQYRGDGIISRAPGYGMHAIRVDGNDALAVYTATAEARRIALAESRPVMIEAMTYRVGHHSTSDDWSRYRGAEEVREFQGERDPVNRLRMYLERKGIWNVEEDLARQDRDRLAVMSALKTAEKKAPPPLSTLFDDVFKEVPPHLQEQRQQMLDHIALYPDHYTIKKS